MSKRFLFNLVFSVFLFSLCLFNYLGKMNSLTKMKLELPKVEKEVYLLKEENKRLKYEIDRFESPNHLMELARKKEFSHLKHPLVKDILKIDKGVAVSSKEFLKNEFSE